MSEASSSTIQYTEYSSHSDDVVIGCFAGHPAEVILVLTEEITQLTSMVAELNTSIVRLSADFSGHSATLNIISEGMPILDALMIVTRSLHNCRVFGYYSGIQKLTALMKGAVVQLKTISGALSADEKSSNSTMEWTGLLQQILVYVVSIIYSFIDLNSNVYERGQLCSNTIGFVSRGCASPVGSSGKVPSSEIRLRWHQRAVVSVMEAGGLNWLVGKVGNFVFTCSLIFLLDRKFLFITYSTSYLDLVIHSENLSPTLRNNMLQSGVWTSSIYDLVIL
ncbi:hypothetical protein ACFX1S_044403 [Malus domestica]